MKKYIALIILLLCGVPSADAAFRIYLVPVIVNGEGFRVPKYFGDGTIPPSTWSAVHYGRENWTFVGADLSLVDDATIVSQPDGFGLPFDLTQTLSAGQVTAVQTRLEAGKIPAHWVSTSLTWRQVLRTVLGMSHLLQRFKGRDATNFFAAVTLSDTINTLPVPARASLLAAATDLGLSTAGITGATTIRQALRIIGEQMRDSTKGFRFNMVVL